MFERSVQSVLVLGCSLCTEGVVWASADVGLRAWRRYVKRIFSEGHHLRTQSGEGSLSPSLKSVVWKLGGRQLSEVIVCKT